MFCYLINKGFLIEYMFNVKYEKWKKTKLQRIWKGIKLGWSLPSLPVSEEKFHNHLIIRIFRVLGGISILLVLSKW